MPSLTTFKLLKQEHNARRGEFKTVHGTVQTPAFQNVATAGAIKGGLSAQDLQQIGTQVMLCNTYHLHLRPYYAPVWSSRRSRGRSVLRVLL